MTPDNQQGIVHAMTLEQIRVCILIERDLTVLNISQNGLAVQTVKPLTMGQVYSLQLTCEGKSVTLDGEVARCNLSEIAETVNGIQEPCYLNGLHFAMNRNPLELSLLDILYSNTMGEKRRSTRIKPLQRMTLDIGNPCFTRVKSFTERGILLQSTELIDLDRDWNLMIQADGRSLVINGRVVHASKKTNELTYSIQVEFIGLDEGQKAWLDLIVRKLEESLY